MKSAASLPGKTTGSRFGPRVSAVDWHSIKLYPIRSQRVPRSHTEVEKSGREDRTRWRSEELVECDRQRPYAAAGGVVDGVGDRCWRADDADLAEAPGSHRVCVRIRFA
jgi:hypothetical protein